jgi:hypothetical protein
MAEWSIAAVLKTVEGQTSGGSNPSLSAYHIYYQQVRTVDSEMGSLGEVLEHKRYGDVIIVGIIADFRPAHYL